MRGAVVAVLIVLAVLALSGQGIGILKHTPVSVVSDWTQRHVIFSQPDSIGVIIDISRDPRYWQQQWRRYAVAAAAGRVGLQGAASLSLQGVAVPNRPAPAGGRDWSVSLGGASVRPQSFPAKFTFDVTTPPSCTADFVVTGINGTPGSGQANIIGLNRLYTNASGTGYCPTATGPAFMFAYSVGSGPVPAAVVLSLDGKKVAYSENNGASTYFHVLTYATGTGNGTDATHPVVPGTGNTATDSRVLLGETTTTTPFVDYLRDVAYVTTTTHVHKIAGVFKGTPTEVTGGTSGWPVTMTGAAGLSTPVFDQVTRHVFYKDFNGIVYYIDDSVSPAVLSSTTFAVTSGNDGSSRPVIVDSTRGKIYAASNGATGTYSVIGQADTSLGSQVRVNVGSADANGATSFGPDLNNAYYAGPLSSAYLYAVGNDRSGNLRPALYRIGFTTGWVMSSTTHDGPILLTTATAAAGVRASPLTEFYNTGTTPAKDFLFAGITDSCSTGVTGGCIRSIDITDPATFPTATSVNTVILGAAGGTSGITVDNVATCTGCSSVYYVTLTGNTLVKATQAGLL